VVAVLLTDSGVGLAFGVLAVVALLALIPALFLPSPRAERQLLSMRDNEHHG
jgi:hypothetical protein